MTATIQFNTAATQALQGRTGGKLRMEVRDGTLMVRPTDRKAGPHVLTEYRDFGKNGIAVDIDDKQFEKLAAGELLADKTEYLVAKDKYGWFALRAGSEVEGAIEGSKATVKAAASE
jgi:hypothetical protein